MLAEHSSRCPKTPQQLEWYKRLAVNPKISVAQLQPLPPLSAPNKCIHEDLFVRLQYSNKGKQFVLVVTFMHYMELVAITYKENETVTKVIWYSEYGAIKCNST